MTQPGNSGMSFWMSISMAKPEPDLLDYQIYCINSYQLG
jgi:hypothetical protein